MNEQLHILLTQGLRQPSQDRGRVLEFESANSWGQEKQLAIRGAQAFARKEGISLRENYQLLVNSQKGVNDIIPMVKNILS